MLFHDVSVNSGDSRQTFTDDVPHEIRRFIWCTSPHKCWAEYLAGNWYSSVQIMRKYDGWFLVVYVDYNGNVRWQTTSGFVHSVLAKEIEPLKAHMEALVADGRLKPTHALKLEIVVTNDSNEDFLHLVGKKLDGHYYRLTITDFFQPYSPEMIQDLNARLETQQTNARKHKTAPLSAEGWLNSFQKNQGNVLARLANAQTVLGLAALPNVRIADCVNMHKGASNISGKRIVVQTSKSLTEQSAEGFVLHCTDRAGKYVVYKLKLEYMGGLGSFYSPSLDDEIHEWNATLTHSYDLKAGRQFVVRCLTVECFHDTHIPLRLGVGYYDEDMCMWVVSDSVRVKYTNGPRLGRYLDIQEGVKHAGITRQIQHMANMIAKILDIAKPTNGTKNLHQTSHFKKESSGNFLNVAELGILVGGNANHVYQSGNFHLQAVVLKCIGMATSSSHSFTNEEIQHVREFTTPVMHGTPEWTKADWARMVDLKRFFNASNVLSTCTPDCMLWQSLDAIRAVAHVPKVIYSKLENLRGIRCCCYGVAEKGRVGAIVRYVKGECVDFPYDRIINDADGIHGLIDIVFIPNKFNKERFDNMKKQIQSPFLTVRCSWPLNCEKNQFQLPDIAHYAVEYTAETFDEQRFLWNRAHRRISDRQD
jgi:hypothetical protein